jgi:RNA polymerase sigma factor (sigma-70 family)
MTTLAPVIDLAARRKHVDELIAEHAEWAKSVARRQLRGAHSSVYASDAESAALVGLWKAARSWDGEGNFRGFANCRVRNAVIDEYRHLTHRGRSQGGASCRCGGLDLNCFTCNGTGHALPVLMLSVEALSDAGLQFTAMTHRDELAEVIELADSQLTGRQLEVVRRTANGETLAAIALSWGRTESRVSQVLTQAKTKLRAALCAELIEGGDAA